MLWLLLPSALAGSPMDEASAAPKIINGEPATAGQFPQTGAILYDGAGIRALICSSTLIAPDVVMLAAHCVDPDVLGAPIDGLKWSQTADLDAFDGMGAPEWPADAVTATDWVYETDWSYAALQPALAENHDVGLVFLDTALVGHPLGYLPTAAEAATIAEGDAVTIVGWGMTDPMDPTSYGTENWGASTVDALSDAEFQVGEATDAVRKCHGDSGGPTFRTFPGPASVDERVIGITSHAWDDTDCTETGGVDTRVDHYLEWIDAEMTSRCADGTRVWCDTPGILSPPVPRSTEELLSEIELVGCSTAPVRNHGWALLGVSWLLARRRRAGRAVVPR